VGNTGWIAATRTKEALVRYRTRERISSLFSPSNAPSREGVRNPRWFVQPPRRSACRLHRPDPATEFGAIMLVSSCAHRRNRLVAGSKVWRAAWACNGRGRMGRGRVKTAGTCTARWDSGRSHLFHVGPVSGIYLVFRTINGRIRSIIWIPLDRRACRRRRRGHRGTSRSSGWRKMHFGRFAGR